MECTLLIIENKFIFTKDKVSKRWLTKLVVLSVKYIFYMRRKVLLVSNMGVGTMAVFDTSNIEVRYDRKINELDNSQN